jgi:hypothetical protein
VAPGQVQVASLRLDSWRPPPGQQWTRQLTVTASDGQATVESSGSLMQESSRAAIELLGVRLDPTVLRLPNRSEGRLAATVDNRNGAQPIRVALRGDDPENVIRFTFAPAVLDVPAGQLATSVVRVRAPRPPGGAEVTRPFMIMATDGRSEAQTNGSIVQSSSSRRPIARALFTLFGGLAMILAAFRPWRAVSEQLGVGIDVDELMRLFGFTLINLGGFEQFLSVGLALAGLGVLAIFGLTGRSGRLTRLAAFLGALLVIGVLVTFAISGNSGFPGTGALLALAGCISAYIGGKLIKR